MHACRSAVDLICCGCNKREFCSEEEGGPDATPVVVGFDGSVLDMEE